MLTTNRLGTLVLAAGLAACAGLCGAGPLNPPVGAIGSTAKPLAEIEPRTAINAVNTPGDTDSVYKITQPGSYYLTGTLIGVVGKRGIEIALPTDGPTGTALGVVSIDLNGFALETNSNGTGQGGGAGTLEGIKVIGFASVTVRNGVVRGWGGHGLDLSGPGTVAVTGVSACDNSGTGIFAPNGAVITNCFANGNFRVGIEAGGGSVTDCTANSNGGDGFSVSIGTISRCTATGNNENGIHAATCVVTDCVGRANQMNGFYDNGSATFQRCVADSNAQDGFNLGGETSVTDSVATNNRGDGIECAFNCTVRGNTCALNGSKNAGHNPGAGAAIHVYGDGNRIEGNTCTQADRGVQVDSVRNIIIRNTCRGNTTNWQIAAGNSYGPIVNGGAGAGYTGNGTAASSLGSTDPSANFNY